ncbi:ATP-grasp fold amidoligase family protein [Candidatus Bipolaricaulota bacterium]
MWQMLSKITKQGTLERAIAMKLSSPLRPLVLYHRVVFRLVVGYWPHLHQPRSFTEKILWLRLYFDDPRLVSLTDKLSAREYVRRVTPEVCIPQSSFAVDNADDIPFDQLPDKCVIKSTFGEGARHIIFFDRTSSDPYEVRQRCREWLAERPRGSREKWPFERIYQGRSRQVFEEELLTDDQGRIPKDYKIYVFHGCAKFLVVICDRFSNATRTYYDTSWNLLDMRTGGYPSVPDIPKPTRLQDMLRVAERLASDLPFVRVDLYVINEELYFSELTLYPGTGPFEPQRFDFEFGAQLTLPVPLKRRGRRGRSISGLCSRSVQGEPRDTNT